MQQVSPFAYGPVGQVLVTTDGRLACVTPEGDNGPSWGYEAGARVVGVRNTPDGVLVLDAQGRLVRLERDAGRRLGMVQCPAPATALAAAPDGTWAVVHPDGVTVGQADRPIKRYRVADARGGAFADSGDALAVVTEQGNLVALDLRAGGALRRKFQEPVTGLAWSRLGWWLVTTPRVLYRVDRDLSQAHELARTNADASGGVVSPDGCLCAFRIGDRQVSVIGVKLGQVGVVRYPNRIVGELEFGPTPWLGIGIGNGDGNCVSLHSDAVHRTEVLPGRVKSRWLVASQIDARRVREEQAKLPAAAGAGRHTPSRSKGRVAAMVITSTLVTLLAVCAGCGGWLFGQVKPTDLGEVPPAQTSDARSVPPGSFVTLSGRPDATKIGDVLVEDEVHHVLVLKEAPHLILYCKPGQPLNAAAARYEKAGGRPTDPKKGPSLDEVWKVQGRIYDGGDGGAPYTTIPYIAIDEFATKNLGVGGEKDYRVLVVDMTPDDVTTHGWLACGIATVVGVLAAILWLLTLVFALLGRARRSSP